jgi:hypothetical protein
MGWSVFFASLVPISRIYLDNAFLLYQVNIVPNYSGQLADQTCGKVDQPFPGSCFDKFDHLQQELTQDFSVHRNLHSSML